MLHQAAARDCPEIRPESEIEISRGGARSRSREVERQAATRGDGEMVRLLLRLNPHLDVGIGGQA